MNKLLVLIVLVLLTACKPNKITLVKNGTSNYEILIANNPDSQIVKASDELQKYIEKITGVRIPIETLSNENPNKPKILVGAYPDDDGFNVNNVFYRVDKGNLIIGGGSPKSILYSVYTFLEKEMACIWLAPGEEQVTQNTRIDIPFDLDYNYTPQIETRTVHSKLFYDNHDFADKRKVTYEAFPGYVPGARVHTFNRFMPETAFYKSHPEYYALRGNKRLTTQLCLTNPDVLRIVKDSVKAHFERNPGLNIVSVSQDDNTQYCECEDCAEIDRQEGSHSGTMIRFVNQVANAFPEKTISTLAYQYTRKPCITKPADNVLVTLCSIECDRSKSIEEGCSDFADDLKGWKELSENIRIWDYTTQFTNFLAPFPNIRTLEPNIRFFRDNNAKWVFEQHSHNPSELFELRSYLMAKLLWNPDLNADKVITEFCIAYYGDASQFIKGYINGIHNEIAKVPEFFLFLYGDPSQGFNSFLRPEKLEEYNRLFLAASDAVAGNKVLVERVERAKISTLYATLEASRKGVSESFILDSEAENRLKLFEKICAENNITAMNEMRFSVDEYISLYKSALERSKLDNKASGKKVTLNTKAKKYAGEDPLSLSDGALGGNSFYSNWLGFEGNAMEAIIDLGQEESISSLNTAFLQVTNHIVFFPEYVRISYSSDNVSYKTIDLKRSTAPLAPDSKINDIEYFNFRFEPVYARYIKLYASNINIAPEWHNASGLPAWIFCDEIIVN